MPITYDETANEVIAREKPGWRQHTPCPQHRLRCYEDCSPDDAHHKAIIDHFTSMTSALRTGFPTDFTNAAVYNVVDEALANWDYLCELHPTEPTPGEFGDDKPSRRKQMVAYRDVSLNRASARGTAVHSYVEARLLGLQPDWEDLATNNALTWVAAVENFLDKEQPEPVLIETVCFDRERMVAGTVDALLKMRGATYEIDHKTRAQKEKRHFTHARRPKESAQLGGYYKMLTQGYYMDDRGRRQQVPATDLGIAVITYGEDGTYAIHDVDPANSVEAYECSMEMREKSKLSFLMPNKAIYSDDFDPNPLLRRAIDNVPDDAPEKMELSLAWKKAGFGKPSEGEVEASRYGEAMHLIYRVTAQHQPFVGDNPEPVAIVSADVVGELNDRLSSLPEDIAEEARRNAAGLPPLSSLRITQADVDDWDRVLRVAEEVHTQRQREAINVYQMARQIDGALALLPEDLGTWTDRDLTLATAIVSAMETKEITANGASEFSVSDELDRHDGKKAGVKKLAKTKASELGLDVPSKWDELVSDPVLWAVLVAT